jgi:phosphoglycolate phosphatase
VIFDLDGTLVDHFEAIYKCLSLAFEKVGAPPRSFDEVKAAVGGSHEATLRKFVTEAQFAEAVRHYREAVSGPTGLVGVRLLDGARDVLMQLRRDGVKTAVLTNKWGELSRRLMRHLEVEQLLDVVMGFEDTPWRKPQAELTRHTLEKLGVAPTEALMVGDSPFDVATGRAAGMKVCCVPTGTHTREQLETEKPDWIVASLRDVTRIVRSSGVME